MGVPHPALVTPPREEEVRCTGRKVGRRLRRLLTFQATLEKEKGLPPSRWQKTLEFGEEGEATLLNTPVSRRRRGRRSGGVRSADASSPWLRRGRVEEVSSLSPGGWDGGGHRGYCFSCRSWGNMVPIV